MPKANASLREEHLPWFDSEGTGGKGGSDAPVFPVAPGSPEIESDKQELQSSPSDATSSKQEWTPAHEHDVRQFFKDLPQKDIEWEVKLAKSRLENNIVNTGLFWDFAWARGGKTLLELTGGQREDADGVGAERGSSPPDLA